GTQFLGRGNAVGIDPVGIDVVFAGLRIVYVRLGLVLGRGILFFVRRIRSILLTHDTTHASLTLSTSSRRFFLPITRLLQTIVAFPSTGHEHYETNDTVNGQRRSFISLEYAVSQFRATQDWFAAKHTYADRRRPAREQVISYKPRGR